MLRRRTGSRWVLPISTVAATALLSLALVGPAHAAVGGTSLSVTKTMSGQLVGTYAWTISKSVTPTTLDLDAGESALVEYTVGATKSDAVMSAYFTGEICVTNTGAAATQGLQIIDTVSKPPKKAVIVSTAVDVSGHPVLAPAERHCYPYRVDLATDDVVPGATYKDTAKVTIANKSGRSSSGASPSATAVLPTSASTLNNARITLADSNGSTFMFAGSGTGTYTQLFECDADAGTHTNTLSAEDFVATGAVDTPAPASATVTVNCPSADVGVLKTADAAMVSAGGAVGFTVAVSNAGSGSASGVSLSDPLPAGVAWSIDSQSGSACSITGALSAQVLSCTFGSLASAASASVHVAGSTGPEDCGILSNVATVSATNEPASAAANNSSTATVTVVCPDVAVLKASDAATVDAGDAVGFTVIVSNAGLGSASGVSLSDPLPAGVDWTIDLQSGSACSITGPVSAEVLSCAFGSLAPTASASVHVTGVTGAEDCGALSNTATVSATNEAASAGGDNSSTATVTVRC